MSHGHFQLLCYIRERLNSVKPGCTVYIAAVEYCRSLHYTRQLIDRPVNVVTISHCPSLAPSCSVDTGVTESHVSCRAISYPTFIADPRWGFCRRRALHINSLTPLTPTPICVDPTFFDTRKSSSLTTRRRPTPLSLDILRHHIGFVP